MSLKAALVLAIGAILAVILHWYLNVYLSPIESCVREKLAHDESEHLQAGRVITFEIRRADEEWARRVACAYAAK